MQVTSTKLLSVFSEAFDKIRKGELKTLIPFLYLFRLNGKPMNLRYHYQMAPLYNCVQPGHLVLMCGRQLGKSYALCSSQILRSGLVPFYHTVLIQPRADQIQRLMNTVYKPLLSSSPLQDMLISSTELGKLALRQYRNGSLCYAENMLLSADRVRGVSGAASCTFDECVIST